MDFQATQSQNPLQSPATANLAFVDAAVGEYSNLVAAASPQAQVFLLDPKQDEIEQVSEIIARYKNVSAVHIFSHGDSGSLQLGTEQLNSATLENYRDELSGWSGSLTDTADILLYGCKVAQGNGSKFVSQLANLTHADVAASTNNTGSQALGGDWLLEYNTGAIEAATIQSPTYDLLLHDPEEHQEFLNFLATFNTTHTAIKDGLWSDPNTWDKGQIPGSNANVLIPQGRKVIYDSESSVSLMTTRVDGALEFASDKNTKMRIDTLAIAPTGQLTIGTASNPIQADKTATIDFRSDTTIDINSSLDPTQLGKGLVSHGQVSIYGADKLDYVKLQGNALAGSHELVLDLPTSMTSPAGWKVGDQLVLGGTYYDRYGSDVNNSRFHDESLTITAIDGNRIRFKNNDIQSGDNTVLRFDHETTSELSSQYNLKLYVANTTRNVSFESEGGPQTAIERRGHVMLMHNPRVVVENAGFYNLGRTNKTKLIDDVEMNRDGTPGGGTNIRGRYALHFHKTGTDDNTAPIIASGNAIVGSPGWGISQHDSNVILENNVIFDVVGAAYVAEAGTEIGQWKDNLAIKITGQPNDPGFSPVDWDRARRYDYGYEGDGYWVGGTEIGRAHV